VEPCNVAVSKRVNETEQNRRFVKELRHIPIVYEEGKVFKKTYKLQAEKEFIVITISSLINNICRF